MLLVNYLSKQIRDDLTNLLEGYIKDAETIDERIDLENQILELDDLTLEELVKKNLEFVHPREMEDFMKSYVDNWLNLYT